MRPPTARARRLTLVGLLLAVAVPFTLLAHWGRLHLTVRDPQALHTVTTTFGSGAFPAWFRFGLIALSGLVVAFGIVALTRPRPWLLLCCCLALGAELVLIVVEANSQSLFEDKVLNADTLNVVYGLSSTTIAAALILSGAALLAMLASLVASLRKQTCPDCAERVRRSDIDCPHCGYHLALPSGMKRCDECDRVVKEQARVCRHCGHRFDQAPEQVST